MPGNTGPERQDMQLKLSIPVAVHRWFTHGEGWAYHPDLEPHLPLVQQVTVSVLENRKALWQAVEQKVNVEENVKEFDILNSGRERFAYVHRPDMDCLDEKARGRFPTILVIGRITGLSTEEVSRLKENFLSRLNDFVPKGPGLNDSLIVHYSCPVQPRKEPAFKNANMPEPPGKESKASRGAPFTIAICLIIVCVAIGIIGIRVCSHRDDRPFPVSESALNVPEGADGAQSENPEHTSTADAHPPTPSAPAVDPAKRTSAPPKKPMADPRWKIEAAWTMLACLTQWNKHGRLSMLLGKASSEVDDAALSDNPRAISEEQANQIIRRFFYVLSQKPVEDLLSQDVRKNTWEGKFVCRFPEGPPRSSQNTGTPAVPATEEELYQWLSSIYSRLDQTPDDNLVPRRDEGIIQTVSKPLEGLSPARYAAPARPRSVDIIERIRNSCNFRQWKEQLGERGFKVRLEDCTNEKLKRWVHDFK